MSKQSVAFLGVVILVSFVTSWITSALAGRPPALVTGRTGAGVDRDDPSSTVADDALAMEVRALRRALDDALARVRALEERPPAVTRVPAGDWANRTEPEVVPEPLLSTDDASDAQPATAAPEKFKTRVAKALAELRKDEVLENHRKNSGRLEERVTRLTEQLDLSGYQTNEMRTILRTRDERYEGLIRMWQQGVDERVLADSKREIGEEFQGAIERVLTPEQLATLQQSTAQSPAK